MFKQGGLYNFRNQPERLVYVGAIKDPSGIWHQFELIDKPGTVWAEVASSDVGMIEESTHE